MKPEDISAADVEVNAEVSAVNVNITSMFGQGEKGESGATPTLLKANITSQAGPGISHFTTPFDMRNGGTIVYGGRIMVEGLDYQLDADGMGFTWLKPNLPNPNTGDQLMVYSWMPVGGFDIGNFLTKVYTDETLSGDGTIGNPLSVIGGGPKPPPEENQALITMLGSGQNLGSFDVSQTANTNIDFPAAGPTTFGVCKIDYDETNRILRIDTTGTTTPSVSGNDRRITMSAGGKLFGAFYTNQSENATINLPTATKDNFGVAKYGYDPATNTLSIQTNNSPTPPTIPGATEGDAKITFTQGGQIMGISTMNQNADQTVDFVAGDSSFFGLAKMTVDATAGYLNIETQDNPPAAPPKLGGFIHNASLDDPFYEMDLSGDKLDYLYLYSFYFTSTGAGIAGSEAFTARPWLWSPQNLQACRDRLKPGGKVIGVISGNIDFAEVKYVLATPQRVTDAANAFASICQSKGLDGVCLNFEDLTLFTQAEYNAYISLSQQLYKLLDAKGKILVQATGAYATQPQGYFRYEHFFDMPNLGTHELCLMAYNLPQQVLSQVYDYVLSRIDASSANPVNMPNVQWALGSYGYMIIDGVDYLEGTYADMSQAPGFSSAIRDPGTGILRWSNGGIDYNLHDQIGLNKGRQILSQKGANKFMTWHIGGSQWFSGGAPFPLGRKNIEVGDDLSNAVIISSIPNNAVMQNGVSVLFGAAANSLNEFAGGNYGVGATDAGLSPTQSVDIWGRGASSILNSSIWANNAFTKLSATAGIVTSIDTSKGAYKYLWIKKP